ncbi:cyclic nucleotide-binding domain-containing protein [Algoriphagus aestuarii]|nr:cyclic nucleotide-binding domain-containing protein [Algoriphagus aestuarii]
MANVIVNRVAEFLKGFPPFSYLSKEDLELIASNVEINYVEQGEQLFLKGDPAQPHFFIVKEGAIALTENRGGKEEIAEFCDQGDVFGVLALLGKRPYVLNAQASEDSLIYLIPVTVFESILEHNSRVALYFAAGFASGQVVVRQDLSQGQIARKALGNHPRDHSLLIFSDPSIIKISENVLTGSESLSIQEAAKQMSIQEVSSIVIVNDQGFPKGILTDKDLRNRVVAEGVSLNTPVGNLMSSKLIVKKSDASFSDLYLCMIRNRLHHLILTEDGTIHSPVKGIISDHDILLSMGNSPAVLIHALLNTQEVSEMKTIRDRAEQMLRYYLENEVAMDFVASVMTEINDVMISQAKIIAVKKHSKNYSDLQEIKFCFLSLGSEGREEQLLRTDQDNALIYADVPKKLEEKAKEYFLKLGTEIVEILIQCGISPCPGDMMTSNPKWVQPLSVWKEYFSEWILRPTEQALLHASIFFDFRPVAGHFSLSEQLAEHIYLEVHKKQVFLNFLAKNAYLNPAPLGFFKGFIVEKSGEHRDQFDIKSRAMMPLADLARLLTLSHGLVKINNTFKRFEKLAELEPLYSELFIQAGKAYEILMRMRALEGLHHGTNGRYIQPENLGKLQKRLLRNTFSPISELQEIVKIRFQLDYFTK